MATHIASPHNSRAPQNTRGKMPPTQQEDIGSVLERFHKWAGQQPEPIREISYEEAVARSRRRFYAEDEPPRPEPVTAAAAPVPAPPPPIPFPLVKEPPVNAPSSKPSRTAPAKSSKTTRAEDPPEEETGTSRNAAAKPAPKAAVRKKAASAAKPHTAQKKSAKASTARAAKAKPSTESQKAKARPSLKQSRQSATLAAAMETASTANPAAASVHAEEQRATAAPQAHPRQETTFAQVLAAQIDLPEVEPAGTSPTQGREPAATPAARPVPAKVFAVAPLPDDVPPVHLTVRLASEERESLRDRARDLGITPSAYVRQCALEVDSLRTELDHIRLAQAQVAAELALAREQVRSAQSETALCLNPRASHRREKESEWFQRLRNFVFPRKAKGQAFATHA